MPGKTTERDVRDCFCGEGAIVLEETEYNKMWVRDLWTYKLRCDACAAVGWRLTNGRYLFSPITARRVTPEEQARAEGARAGWREAHEQYGALEEAGAKAVEEHLREAGRTVKDWLPRARALTGSNFDEHRLRQSIRYAGNMSKWSKEAARAGGLVRVEQALGLDLGARERWEEVERLRASMYENVAETRIIEVRNG